MAKTAKHKLTPQAHKQIIEAARVLPKLVRLNKDGSQQYRKVNEYKGASDFVEGKGYTKHSEHRLEPVFINHEVEMVNRFWQHGEAGVQAYIDHVNAIAARHEAKEHTPNPELVDDLAKEIEQSINSAGNEGNS